MGQENIAGRSQVAWRLIGHEAKEGRVRANFQLWAGGGGGDLCLFPKCKLQKRNGEARTGSRNTQVKMPRKQWAIRTWGSGTDCKSVNKYFLRTPRCTGHARVDQRALLRGSQGWRR